MEGGNGAFFHISMLNDTGSDMLTIFEHDTMSLAMICPSYMPQVWMEEISGAGGAVDLLPCFNVEMQMETENGVAWGP